MAKNYRPSHRHPLQHGARKDLVAALFQALRLLKDFKNDLYLKLARNFLRFRWLLTYLYGAPLAKPASTVRRYPPNLSALFATATMAMSMTKYSGVPALLWSNM